jgi:hypothetical protein
MRWDEMRRDLVGIDHFLICLTTFSINTSLAFKMWNVWKYYMITIDEILCDEGQQNMWHFCPITQPLVRVVVYCIFSIPFVFNWVSKTLYVSQLIFQSSEIND